LIALDDSVQRATVEQQKSQAEAAFALLQELKAQPRPENLKVAEAQVQAAIAVVKNAQDQFDKQQNSYALDPKSVSKDTLDNVTNALKMAKANLEVTQKQYELTKAGAWIYDIKNQERQYNALSKAYAASDALLSKYTVKAPIDGVVLSISAALGSYISPQGMYDTYSQGSTPIVVMGASPGNLGVRVYVDEILIHRLPDPSRMHATMFIRGTAISVPLEYVRVQPYVSPKIELSDQRTERVDVRVLPVIFKFEQTKKLNLYPGQLVDVYIAES
jgi:HlyD family secretion protein